MRRPRFSLSNESLSDLVNAAYGLTPDEVALMWRTAPPRMPLDPADEVRRIGINSGNARSEVPESEPTRLAKVLG